MIGKISKPQNSDMILFLLPLSFMREGDVRRTEGEWLSYHSRVLFLLYGFVLNFANAFALNAPNKNKLKYSVLICIL